MAKDIEAVVAGHICLDVIPTLSKPHFEFLPGRVSEIGPVILSTGGAVSNTGLALHRLGIQTRLMGKIGTDFFGQVIKQLVASHGPHLTDGMIEVRDGTSSYTVILSPPDADRMFLHCPGCNDTFEAADVDYDLLAGARLFHFGYPPIMHRLIEDDGAELVKLLRTAKDTGITTSLDMCMPDPRGICGQADWWRILARALPFVDIFLPSLDEMVFMLYTGSVPELVQGGAGGPYQCTSELLGSLSARLLGMGPAVVGLKLGSMGLYLRTADPAVRKVTGRAIPADPGQWEYRELWSPCFEAALVGATGAGDAAIAGFLAALLRGKSPEECMTMACALGACNVEAADALGGLRSWKETWARIDAGWPRKAMPSAPAGWRVDPMAGLWHGPSDPGG